MESPLCELRFRVPPGYRLDSLQGRLGGVDMNMNKENKNSAAEQSYVIVAREYADVVHMENPAVIERILSASRTEKVAYVSALLTSGISRYALAGPKVAFTAMAVEALTDFGKEVSEWFKRGLFPEDFSRRSSGYQTWVELLKEIDSNPVDAERLKAMKAMFLAANLINATDGQSILAYQLFGIARKLTSGDLLVLRAARQVHGGPESAQVWLGKVANAMGHGLTALIELHERVLVDYGLLTQRFDQGFKVNLINGRLTDLGAAFCRNLDQYEAEKPRSE